MQRLHKVIEQCTEIINKQIKLLPSVNQQGRKRASTELNSFRLVELECNFIDEVLPIALLALVKEGGGKHHQQRTEDIANLDPIAFRFTTASAAAATSATKPSDPNQHSDNEGPDFSGMDPYDIEHYNKTP